MTTILLGEASKETWKPKWRRHHPPSSFWAFECPYHELKCASTCFPGLVCSLHSCKLQGTPGPQYTLQLPQLASDGMTRERFDTNSGGHMDYRCSKRWIFRINVWKDLYSNKNTLWLSLSLPFSLSLSLSRAVQVFTPQEVNLKLQSVCLWQYPTLNFQLWLWTCSLHQFHRSINATEGVQYVSDHSASSVKHSFKSTQKC
jgi:hypothetical protein